MPTDTSEHGLESLILQHLTGADGLAFETEALEENSELEAEG